VASFAALVGKTVADAAVSTGSMTIAAGHGSVRPTQLEPALVVTRGRERRRREPVLAVAAVAAVGMGRGGELFGVGIFVAVGATGECELEAHLRARSGVALRASHARVPGAQRIGGEGMLGDGEGRRLEPGGGVTLRAFAAAGAPSELPLVGIAVAVTTAGVSQRPAEVCAFVAGSAGHLPMLAGEREGGLAVIVLRARRFPRVRAVARLARRRKAPAMRIGVAGGAAVEAQTLVNRLVPDPGVGPVALRARHAEVRTREREPGLAVVEAAYALPVLMVVTLQTMAAQLATVLVLVAGRAGRGQAEEGPVEDTDLDVAARGGGNAGRIVTALAGESAMFAFQRISGLRMVELLLRGLPVHQAEVFAVVLGVAVRTVGAATLAGGNAPMVARAGIHPLCDLDVAIDATELALARRGRMTLGAVGGAFQRCMCPRQPAR